MLPVNVDMNVPGSNSPTLRADLPLDIPQPTPPAPSEMTSILQMMEQGFKQLMTNLTDKINTLASRINTIKKGNELNYDHWNPQ